VSVLGFSLAFVSFVFVLPPAKEDLFTIEMHYNGIMSGDDYIYGSVACIDQVDPDYLSMIELTLMAEFVKVEGDLYQFLWPKPGQGIGDGLSCIECEDDVLAFIKARKNVDENGTAIGAPFRLMKVYVKKLSEFEARKRIGQIKMDLFRATFQRRVRFRLEEINEDGDLEGLSGECSDSGLVSRNEELCLLPWSELHDYNKSKSPLRTVVVPANEGVQTHYLPLQGADFVETPCEVPEVVAHMGDDLDGVPTAMNDTCADLEGVPQVVDDRSADLDGGPEEAADQDRGPQEAADMDGAPQEIAELDGGPQDDTCADLEGVPQVVDDRSAGLEGVPEVVVNTSADLYKVLENMVNAGADLEDVPEDGVVNASANLGDVPQDDVVNAGAELGDVPHDSAGPRWLGVDEVLAEMAREEAMNEPIQDDEEGWSSPTIPSSPDTPGEFWDGRYDAYSSYDSDSPYVGFPSSPSSSDYAPPENITESSSEADSDEGANVLVSEAGSNGEADSDARIDDDECDRFRTEEQLFQERGWGSEEDEELIPERYPIFSTYRDMEAAEIVIGREFESFAQFKEFYKVNAVKSRRGVKFPVNDKVRCKCVCVKECGFWLSARLRGPADSVVLIFGQTDHECLVEEDIRAANPAFLAKHYVARFRIDPSWSLRNFVHTVVTDFGLKINTMKAYRAKRVALSMIHGEESDQFKKLWDYGAELRRTNPGTTVDIRYDGLTFQSIYICLDALKNGFKAGCRRFIGLDGCHLKNIPGWQLLAAVGVDGNDGMFPIAWAVVERECEDSWGWFMELLKGDLGIPNAPGWTFMSDRQKRRGVHSWCKYYFETLTTCDISLNNHCESFNKWILEARDMPVLSCLEAIRFKLMRRLTFNFIKVASLDSESLCPHAYDVIKERKKLACMCYPTFSGAGMFEVREGLKSWVVDMRAMQCACGLWQLSGLPCEHALACISYNRDPIEPYCNPCYTVGTYRFAYENSINPLNDASQWPDSFGPQLRPPTLDKPTSGKKQKKRRLEAGELATKKDNKGKSYKRVRRTGEKQKCSICKKIGHNKRAHGSGLVNIHFEDYVNLYDIIVRVMGSNNLIGLLQVNQDCNGASSSNPVPNTASTETPPHLDIGTSTQRVTRSKMRVTRGGHT
ncbi:hypothetical protein LINPERHAP2_LOCUS37594, partial [Linum perenne]